MVSVQNLHKPTLWRFFFARSPHLSADIPGLSVARSRDVSHRCHLFMTVWSHARTILLVCHTWAVRRIHTTCRGPALQGQLIPGLCGGEESARSYKQRGLSRWTAQGDVVGTDTAREHSQACPWPWWVAMCRVARVI
jgi:hypothetical protein